MSRKTTLLALLVLSISACERPFLEPLAPDFEIIEPDFSTVFSASSINVVVRTALSNEVDVVGVNGDSLSYDSESGLWSGSVPLRTGLNRLIVWASGQQTESDTVYAYRGGLIIHQTGPGLPQPRGGHAATPLADGSVLVTGGAERVGRPASKAAFLLSAASDRFVILSTGMTEARSGHTASLLPDGRVLLLGGSSVHEVDDVADLVTRVELFDPETETFQVVPFRGDPIRRAFHTAVVRTVGDVPLIDLYGGRGDVRYGTQPVLGTRRDLRSFVFRNDSLIALNSAPGPSLDFAISGHVQIPIRPDDPSRSLVAGTVLTTHPRENVSFILDYDASTGISQDTTGRLLVERTRHAAENLQSGLIGVFGGGNDDSPALADVELYVHSIGRFFKFPPSEFVLRRFGLTATKLPNDRILLLGGFSPSGEALTDAETFLAPTL